MSETRRWTMAVTCGALAAAVGLLAGLADSLSIAPSIHLFANPQPMPPTTASAFVLCGATLILGPHRQHRWLTTALLVLLWGLSIAGLVVPIHHLPPEAVPAALATPPGELPPGLMSPNSAVGFLLFSLAVVVMLVWSSRGRVRLLGTIGPLLVALAAIALLGQAAAIESPYRWGNLHAMSQATAVAFMLLGMGLCAQAWDEARQAGSQPIWLPLMLSGSLALASILAWQALTQQEMRQIRATVAAEADLARNEMAARLDSRALAITRMARRWSANGRPTHDSWTFDARLYFEHYPGLAAVSWIDAAYHPRWRQPPPRPGDRSLGTPGEWRRLLAEVRQSGQLYVGQRVRLPGGRSGPLIAAPLHHGERFDGFVVAILDPTRLIEHSLSEHRLPQDYGMAIFDGNWLVYRHGPDREGIPSGYRQVVPLNLDHLHWTVELWPSRELLDRMTRPLATLLLLAGLTLSWLLGVVVRLTQRAHSRAQEAEAANTALAREVRVREGAEAALARQAEDLRRSNADLEQFAYVASHDLQEPLRMVASYLQLIERRYHDRLDDDGREFIDYAVDGANRMRTLINDLLAYSRVGTRGKPFVPCDLNEAFERAVANLGLAINESEAHVTKSQLPTVLGDPGQLTQLMQNLVGNAIKFRSQDVPQVRVEATQQGGEWACVVRDNGIGVAPEYADRVFLIFQRLHGRAEYEGTGIGLAICKRIVERHGGRIWLTSEPGHGTAIWWTLPMAGESVT